MSGAVLGLAPRDLVLTPAASELIRSAVNSGARGSIAPEVECGGLLTYPAGQDPAEVDRIVLIPCEHRFGPKFHLSPADIAVLRAVAENVRYGGERQIAGYFRTCLDTASRLEAADPRIAAAIPEARWLVLAEAGAPDFTIRDLKAPSRRAGERAIHLPLMRGLWVVAGLLALLVAGFAGLHTRRGAEPGVAGIGLRVEPQGTAMRISWNTKAREIREARSAVIEVNDSSRVRSIRLSEGQIARGTAIYQARSTDLGVRLEVRDARDKGFTEEVRFVGADVQMPVERITVTVPMGAAAAVTSGPAVNATGISRGKVEELPQEDEIPVEVAPPKPAARPFTPLPAKARPVMQASIELSPPALEITPSVQPAQIPDRRVMPLLRVRPAPLTSTAAPPRAIKQVRPQTRVFGKSVMGAAVEVVIEVQVSAEGRVTSARIVSGAEEAGAYLAKESLNAARRWVFEPAKANGHDVPGTQMVTFRFGKGD